MLLLTKRFQFFACILRRVTAALCLLNLPFHLTNGGSNGQFVLRILLSRHCVLCMLVKPACRLACHTLDLTKNILTFGQQSRPNVMLHDTYIRSNGCRWWWYATGLIPFTVSFLPIIFPFFFFDQRSYRVNQMTSTVRDGVSSSYTKFCFLASHPPNAYSFHFIAQALCTITF